MIALDLQAQLNAVAATYDRDRAAAAVNAWGNSFPAEELPFGAALTVGDTRFTLPAKADGAPDHVEALGQHLVLPRRPAQGVALLAFGEMGDQALEVVVEHGDGSRERHRLCARAWLIDREPPREGEGVAFSHLHYPDYELALLRPALWCVRLGWSRPDAIALRLGVNPLFHVLAMTALEEALP